MRDSPPDSPSSIGRHDYDSTDDRAMGQGDRERGDHDAHPLMTSGEPLLFTQQLQSGEPSTESVETIRPDTGSNPIDSQLFDSKVVDTSMLVAIDGFVKGTAQLKDHANSRPLEAGAPIAKTGTRIEQYEVIRPIGIGGMSQVYLARDTRLGRLVALKFLADRSDSQAQRFGVEAHATARFNHENVVTIYDVGEHDGHRYMALEYVEGQTLQDWLHERRLRYELLAGKSIDNGQRRAQTYTGRVVSPSLAVELMLPVVRALCRAHEMGIVHRDLKPANIMLTDTGAVKVLDFGVAKLTSRQDLQFAPGDRHGRESSDSVTRDGFIVGTLPYISPEQLRSTGVDHRTDLWAVGIILFQMVVGHHPLAPFSRKKLRRIGALSKPMPRVLDIRPDIGPLGSVIDRCLIKPLADRMGSATELLAALESLSTGPRDVTLKEDECPFTGLSAFQQSDARRFHGRGRDIASMVSRLRNHQVVTIVGPSGTGKSSFVRAGLIPTLERSGDAWEAFLLRPGRSPLAALADILERVSTESGTDVHARDAGENEDFIQRLRAQPGLLGTLLRARSRKRLRRILLFVDQFEELYTLSTNERERAAFVACLEGIADDAASPLRIVLTLRSDFLDRVAADGSRMRVVTRELIFLPPIGRDGLREALTRPVDRAGYQFESDDMVENMLDTLETTGNPLALLQFTATKLWELRDRERNLITRESYEELGGIAGALARHADGVLAGFSPEEQQLVRSIFLQLVTPERTRAIVNIEELRRVSKNDDAAEEVINHLAAARLLLIERDGERARTGGLVNTTVEIVHESLIESWPRLRRWLDMDHDDAEFLGRLQNAARLWDSSGRVDGLLWREQAALDARQWFERRQARSKNRVELSERDERYLLAVVALAQRSRVRQRRVAIGAFAALVAVAVAVSYLALRADRQAAQAREQAARADRESERVRIQKKELEQEATRARNATRMSAARELHSDPTYVLAILREVEPGSRPRGWSTLIHRALHGDVAEVVLSHPNAVTSASFSFDGRRVVTTSFDNHVRLWQLDNTEEPTILGTHDSWVYASAFSPDGRLVVSGSGDNTARVWDVNGTREPIVLRGHQHRVSTVAFSPNGHQIATGSKDGTIRIWSADGVGDPMVLNGHTSDVSWVSYSPDGRRVVSTSKDQTARIWLLGSTVSPVILRGHNHEVNAAAFSPDGARVVTVSSDQSARLWDATGAGRPDVYRGHDDKVIAVAFSPDGERIATGSWDRTVHIWHASGSNPPRIFRGHGDIVMTVAFDPNGRRVASSSWDGEVRVWDTSKPAEPVVLRGHLDRVYSAVFSPDGARILSASWDRTARLWNADGTDGSQIVGTHDDAILAAAFSPDGRSMVTASVDRTARIWSLDNARAPVELRGHIDDVRSAVFSPDGRQVVTASNDGTIRVWNADGSGEPRIFRGHEGMVFTAVFSPDGARIATSSIDGTARIWNVDGSGEPIVFRGHDEGLVAASFSWDGHLLATGSLDHTARIWRANGVGPNHGLIAILRGHDEAVGLSSRAGGLAFSPDRTRLVTGSDDNTARVWSTDGTGRPVELRGHAEAVNTASFSPNGRRIVTASDDKTIRVWSDLEQLTLQDQRLWRATTYCISVKRRMELLGVTRSTAMRNRAKCLARVKRARVSSSGS